MCNDPFSLIVAQSQPYNLSQSVGRSQKIVMTHPAGGSSTFAQANPNPTSKSVMATNLTAKQKIIMTCQPVSTSALNTQTGKLTLKFSPILQANCAILLAEYKYS